MAGIIRMDDLNTNEKEVKEGWFGGEGHETSCEKKGPVVAKSRSKGFFQSREFFKECEECRAEITGVLDKRFA
ncbi:MAG TPA: hypothetical protein VLE47_02395 [Candidatus Saccharimonadales bacterium]|nr:hypothetical protein [Candidatus Saccharimonadales bacterium]